MDPHRPRETRSERRSRQTRAASSVAAGIIVVVVAVAGAVAPAGTLHAQEPDPASYQEVVSDADGFVHLRWVRPAPLVTNQRFITRWTVLNTGAEARFFATDPCDAELTGDLARSGAGDLAIERDCAPGARLLEPGDSAWVQVRGMLRAPPGQGRFAEPFLDRSIDVASGDGSGVPLDGARYTAPDRVPVVVALDVDAQATGITTERVRELLGTALGGRGLLVPMTEEAARAQVDTAPWLHLEITDAPTGGSATAISACWHRPADGDAGCAALRTSVSAAGPDAMTAPGGPLARLFATLLALSDPVP